MWCLAAIFLTIGFRHFSVDNQVSDGDMIESLKVIHTPGHISLYYGEDGTIFGADHMYIALDIVSIDAVTAVAYAQRLSKIKFDKLLMSHQDSPLVERARETVEQLVSNTIEQIRRQDVKTTHDKRTISCIL
jgi:glyoxylase-like metal-dependent hydrolase (beta-lactamase superfamily II)